MAEFSPSLARWVWLVFLHGVAAAFDHAGASLRSLERAEALWRECTALDRAHLDAKRDPLAAACDARPVFAQHLLALRHLLAFLSPEFSRSKLGLLGSFLLGGDASVDGFLARAGELDLELSQLMFVGKVEPLYFWHGPKRHVPAKFEELLGWKIRGRQVRGLLEGSPRLNSQVSLEPTPPALKQLGLTYPTAARPVDILQNSAVRITTGDTCRASLASVKAGVHHLIASGPTSKAHLQPCLDASLRVTWDASESFMDLFKGESQTPLQDAIDSALASLQRPSLDTLALPPRAWTDKRLSGYVAQSLGQLIKQGKVKAVALAGALPAKQLQKILTSSLSPSFWLVPHDDCSPITPSTLEVADRKRLQVIGFGAACGRVLEHVAEKESLSTAVLLGRWTAELGMALALPYTSDNLTEDLRDIQEAPPLSPNSWRLLSGAAALTRTASLAVAQDFEDIFGLRALIERATKLASSDLQGRDLSFANGSLSKSVWDSLEHDKAQFDDNFFIIYKDNFLSPERYQNVREEAQRLWTSKELDPNCNLDGTDRAGGYVLDSSLRDSSLYKLLYADEEFRRWVSRVNGHHMFPSDFPVELREYPTGSTGMGCHRDLLMYTNATLDLEFVYTIDNLGSCISTFQNRRGETTEVHTRANSLIMLRPDAAMHCVKPATGGHRTILKFIYVGDYRKSPEFGAYTVNECGEDNPNVRAVLARRQPEATAVGGAEAREALEL